MSVYGILVFNISDVFLVVDAFLPLYFPCDANMDMAKDTI